jgi:mRNA interferase RelE/StbE
MAYSIQYKASAANAFKKLPKGLQSRVRSKIDALSYNPRPPGSVKLSGMHDLYRIRIGDYRVVYQVADTLQTIEVTAIAHRREVYRDL